jgi:Na+/H+ antiporter NhaD/arsenite permease-like protein
MKFSLSGHILKNSWSLKLWEEKVFVISIMLAALTSLMATPKLSYIDFKVVLCLFNLMVVGCAFEELKILDKVAIRILNRCKNLRLVNFVMLLLIFLSSMLLTNDVALLTFVPITLIISKKVNINPMEMVIFQTLAANIGSSLTPMGNPQNLFLFIHYGITATQFFKVMIPFVFLGALWILALNLSISKKNFNIIINPVQIKSKKQAILFGILFIVIIFSIFNLISYIFAFVLTVSVVVFMNRSLIKKVDFFLLATFVCFFIAIGNISHIELVNKYLTYLLSSSNKIFFTSVILSQFVSNVPAAILVANFTSSWKEVLIGVNVGGLGTLIASLASVISYKMYVNEAGAENSSGYLIKFTLYNFSGLILFVAINFLLLHFNAI